MYTGLSRPSGAERWSALPSAPPIAPPPVLCPFHSLDSSIHVARLCLPRLVPMWQGGGSRRDTHPIHIHTLQHDTLCMASADTLPAHVITQLKRSSPRLCVMPMPCVPPLYVCVLIASASRQCVVSPLSVYALGPRTLRRVGRSSSSHCSSSTTSTPRGTHTVPFSSLPIQHISSHHKFSFLSLCDVWVASRTTATWTCCRRCPCPPSRWRSGGRHDTTPSPRTHRYEGPHS